MKTFEIKESELKNITLFLTEKQILLHPKISPNGTPDFTRYLGKKFVLILDRNILVKILRLVTNGELKDENDLKIISSLLLWAEFNNIALNSALALIEYSNFHQRNTESSEENNLFLEIFKQYTPKHWLDLATGKSTSIPKIELKEQKSFSFYIEDDHFKMHLLEMLKLSQLYFDCNQSIEDKFHDFFKWVIENILICKYTTYFACMLLGNNSKIFRNKELTYESIIKICKNAAWDLTYLSFWSTQYYYEDNADEIFLFVTMDKELRELFFLTHKESLEIFKKYFGEKIGGKIINSLSSNYIKRDKPEINQEKLDKMIISEKDKLRIIIESNAQSNNIQNDHTF